MESTLFLVWVSVLLLHSVVCIAWRCKRPLPLSRCWPLLLLKRVITLCYRYHKRLVVSTNMIALQRRMVFIRSHARHHVCPRHSPMQLGSLIVLCIRLLRIFQYSNYIVDKAYIHAKAPISLR